MLDIISILLILVLALLKYTVDEEGLWGEKTKSGRPIPKAPMGEVGWIDYVLEEDDPALAHEYRQTLFKNRNPRRNKNRYHENKRWWK